MGWVLMICSILAFCFVLLVASAVSYFSTRRRSKIPASFDEVADLREEVAILREEVRRLREEVDLAKKGRCVVSSAHIREGLLRARDSGEGSRACSLRMKCAMSDAFHPRKFVRIQLRSLAAAPDDGGDLAESVTPANWELGPLCERQEHHEPLGAGAALQGITLIKIGRLLQARVQEKLRGFYSNAQHQGVHIELLSGIEDHLHGGEWVFV